MTNCLFHRARNASAKAAFLFFIPFFPMLGMTHAAAIAKGSAPRYAEKGKVIAVRVDEQTEYVPISPPDSKGRTHGGEAFVHRKQIYRIETDENIYELQGGKDPTMNLGDAVEFRIDGRTARVRVGGRQKKYRIIATTSKPMPKE